MTLLMMPPLPAPFSLAGTQLFVIDTTPAAVARLNHRSWWFRNRQMMQLSMYDIKAIQRMFFDRNSVLLFLSLAAIVLVLVLFVFGI